MTTQGCFQHLLRISVKNRPLFFSIVIRKRQKRLTFCVLHIYAFLAVKTAYFKGKGKSEKSMCFITCAALAIGFFPFPFSLFP